MPLFRVLGLSGSSVQFSPVQLRVVVFYTCFMRLFLSGFIFSGCCSCLLFILILQLNQKAFHRLAVAFRWNAFRLFNTCILTLMLQSFTTYYGHMIAGFEFAALETAYFSSRPGKPAIMVFVGVGPWV